MIVVSIKKERIWIKILLQQYVIINTKIICWIINVWDIWWIESKVEIIEYEPKITEISSSCFDDKMPILSNAYFGLTLGYQS